MTCQGPSASISHGKQCQPGPAGADSSFPPPPFSPFASFSAGFRPSGSRLRPARRCVPPRCRGKRHVERVAHRRAAGPDPRAARVPRGAGQLAPSSATSALSQGGACSKRWRSRSKSWRGASGSSIGGAGLGRLGVVVAGFAVAEAAAPYQLLGQHAGPRRRKDRRIEAEAVAHRQRRQGRAGETGGRGWARRSGRRSRPRHSARVAKRRSAATSRPGGSAKLEAPVA